MERGGVNEATVVPYEASAALSMLLLRDHNMLMVHFVGVPPGTADLLIKFVPPETLERFGGAQKYAAAVDSSLTKVGQLLREPHRLRAYLTRQCHVRSPSIGDETEGWEAAAKAGPR